MAQPAFYDPNVHQRANPRQQYAGGGHPGGYGQAPQLFEDTSAMGQPFGNVLSDPMANMAMQYGETLASTGKAYVDKNLNRWISFDKLKYYFSVDTSYVLNKLRLLLFPYVHSNWSIHYSKAEPAPPRVEVNAPDLYIPSMGFVTFILAVGFAFGVQSRFSPEQLGIAASSTLAWLVFEVLIYLLCLYLFGVTTEVSTLDLTAFCGYKYVGMILCLVIGLTLGKFAYYISLAWTSVALAYFLVRTLRLLILPQAAVDGIAHGNKRRNYLLLMMAIVQPCLMFWLTSSIVGYTQPVEFAPPRPR